MRKIIVFIISILVVSCQKNKGSNGLTQLSRLPKQLKEISGIAFRDNLIYCIEDSGNENKISVIDTLGTINHSIILNNATNVDWEDITFDSKGNLYVGDFGNNNNDRKDLVIYKIDESKLNSDNVTIDTKISFDYPEQIEFPPSKKKLMFDVEAFFEYQNYFYLFTKNRSKNFDGTSYIYKIPNSNGHHHAKLIQEIKLCSDAQNCAITSATINNDGTKYVLLSHSKIWIFENFKKDSITNSSIKELDLNHFSQKEAVCFGDNFSLLIADEKAKKKGGNLYKFNLK